MKLLSIFLPVVFLTSSLSMASAVDKISIETKNYDCHVTFKEPVIGFVSSKENSSDTDRIESHMVKRVLAISSMHAFEKIVDSEVKVNLDDTLTINTGLYEDDAEAIKQNKLAALNADRESLSPATVKKLDTRKRLYKEYKAISCN